MRYTAILLSLIYFGGGFLISEGYSQTTGSESFYPACEARSNTDPGRLHIRASAEQFGAIPPCNGFLQFYINRNSILRSLKLDLIFLDRENDILGEGQVSLLLEDNRAGMYQKEVSLDLMEEIACRNVKVFIQSMICYSDAGKVIDCPEVGINQPDAFRFIKVEDEIIKVCNS